MWTYNQRTGLLMQDDAHVAYGYSGHGIGKNNPSMEAVHNIGPIPRGMWIIGAPTDTTTHGPYVLSLSPAEGTNTYGRDGFKIHGDSRTRPGEASLGCIILSLIVREDIWNSGDHSLRVV